MTISFLRFLTFFPNNLKPNTSVTFILNMENFCRFKLCCSICFIRLISVDRYSPISRDELLDEIFTVVYKAKYVVIVPFLYTYSNDPFSYRQYTGFDHYHALSLLFIIFAIAELFNPETQPYAPEAHEYYHLSRVALQFSPPIYDSTMTSIQALVSTSPCVLCLHWHCCLRIMQIHMTQYLDLNSSDTSSSETAWMHMGYAMRLAQSVRYSLNVERVDRGLYRSLSGRLVYVSNFYLRKKWIRVDPLFVFFTRSKQCAMEDGWGYLLAEACVVLEIVCRGYMDGALF